MAPRAAAVRCLLCAAASGASADTASQGSPPSLGEWPYGATCGDRAARHDDSFDLLRIDPQADAGALQLDEARSIDFCALAPSIGGEQCGLSTARLACSKLQGTKLYQGCIIDYCTSGCLSPPVEQSSDGRALEHVEPSCWLHTGVGDPQSWIFDTAVAASGLPAQERRAAGWRTTQLARSSLWCQAFNHTRIAGFESRWLAPGAASAAECCNRCTSPCEAWTWVSGTVQASTTSPAVGGTTPTPTTPAPGASAGATAPPAGDSEHDGAEAETALALTGMSSTTPAALVGAGYNAEQDLPTDSGAPVMLLTPAPTASPSGSSVATPTPTPAPDSSTTSFPVPTTSLEAPTLAGWELVFRQTVPYTFGGDEWTVNSGDPLDDNFAILDRLESFRVNGSFTFMLRWPADGLMDQVWAQTSNPVTTAGHVTGYQPIDVPYSGQDWGGLRRSVVGTLLDGSNELSFWYALGTQYLSRDGFIPGPATNSSAGIFVSQVELWAKAAPNSAPAPTEAPTLAGWELVFRQTVPYTWGVDEWSVGSDPLDDNFAILDRLESFRINSATRRSGSSSELTLNGSFTFMLRWPADGLKDQVWAQSSNPVTTAGNVTGYQPIDVPYSGQDWGGLRRSVLGALLDGSNEISFWYALGTQYLSRDGFIPGPATNGSSGIFVSQVELWTKAHHDNDAEQPDHETEVFVPEAGAKDDPHITNLAREEFAVNQPGDHTLLRVPADARMPPLLEVSAAILPSGESKCGMYIRSIALSGEWLRGHTVQVRSLRRNKAGSNIAGNETLWPFAVRVSSGGLAAGGAWVPFESLGAGGLLAPSPSQAINSQLPDVFRISAFLKEEFGFLREAETFEFSIGRPGHTAQIHVSQASHQALNIELSAAKNLGTKRLAGLLGTEPHDHQVEVLTDGCKAERQLRRPRGIQDVLRLQAEALPVRKATVGTATW